MGNSLRLTLTSPTQTFTHTTEESSVKIGRSLKCEFNIPKEDLSREHCLFEAHGENYYLTDLGSTNGISVDNNRIPMNEKTKISKDSLVILSGLYTLKINAFEIKTKPGVVVEKINPEIETVSFQLDMPNEKKQKRKPIKRSQREIAVQSPTANFEYVKMIAGFFIILAIVIYQALGE